MDRILSSGCFVVVALTACAGSGDDDRLSTGPLTTTPAVTVTGTGTGPEPTSTASSGTTQADGSTGGTDNPVFDVGMGESTGGECVPTSTKEEVCDNKDDDCNGIIDEVDVGMDGICDCLSIAIIGIPGELAASQFEQWLIDRGTTTERIDPPLIDADVLEVYDVVILDRLNREYTAAEAVAFDEWVSAGGGLMAMTGHADSPVVGHQWPNSILGTFGLGYEGTLLHGPVSDFLPHPISAGLTSVTLIGGFAAIETVAGTSDVVAQLAGPVPIARAKEHAAGKVFVWGDEWIEYDSEWSTMPEITQLWTNIFDWLTPTNLCDLPEG